MGLLVAVWMVVLGMLGAANLIIARRAEAKEVIARLAPYQGWIGAISAVWGLWTSAWMLLHVGWMHFSALLWLTMLLEGLVLLGLGLLLGVGMLKMFIKQPQASQNMDRAVARLAPYQGVLGLIAIGLGVWGLIASFTFHFA